MQPKLTPASPCIAVRYYQGQVAGHAGPSFAHVNIDEDGAMMGFFEVAEET